MFKKIIRIWYVTALLLFFIINLHADIANVYPDDILDFFVFINSSDDIPEITKRIEKHEEKYKDNLFLYSEIVLMKRRVFPTSASSKDSLKYLSALDVQWQKYSEFRNLTAYECMTWANIKTQKIPYLSFGKVIKENRTATKYYKMAVNLDEQNAFAWMSLGVSMLFTPRIAGGSVKKALEYLEKAASSSIYKNDLESYYVNLWLSQAHLKNKNEKKYERAFENARAIFGATPMIQRLQKINEAGKVMSYTYK